MELLIWYLGATALSAFCVWYARRVALKHGWLDIPNERSFHLQPTPRIGGVGIIAPIIAGIPAFFLLGNAEDAWILFFLLVPALLVGLLSLIDDQYGLSRKVRFAGQSLAALVVLFLLRNLWTGGGLPLLGNLLPAAGCGLLLYLWITGLSNAWNFMDGIDGIASLQAAVVLVGWLTILLLHPEAELVGIGFFLLLVLPLGGLSGFLIQNWAPAGIFMGDLGSVFLGYFLAVLPIGLISQGIELQQGLEASVLFAWPFIFDTAFTLFRRLLAGEKILDPHRSHIYQKLAGSFSSRIHGHRMTSLFYALLGLLGIGLYWTAGPFWPKLMVLICLWTAVVLWVLFIRKKNEEKPAAVSSSGPYDVFLSPPEITEVEGRQIREALKSGYIAPVGPQLDAFESALASSLGVEEVQAVSSGTAALHLGLRALGVEPGDHVICPDLTFIASVNPVRYIGAQPVLVDVDPETWALDPELTREAIHRLRKEGLKVRLMVIVHAFGIPADMDRLLQLAQEEDLLILEDCAGAFGTRVNGRPAGTFGDAAAFSFNGNKVLTTSGGGALVLKNIEARAAARRWANQGKAAGSIGYVHDTMGYNYRLSNISAAIGLGQLETVSIRLERKKAIFDQYKSRLGTVPGMSFMPEPAYGRNNYWLTSIGFSRPGLPSRVIQLLKDNRIESSPMWTPMHLQPANSHLTVYGGNVSKLIHEQFISLPSGSSLKSDQVERICDLIVSSSGEEAG